MGEGTVPAKCPTGKSLQKSRERLVEPHLQKYFPFPVGQIISTDSHQPIPKEGRFAIVTDAGWDAVDARTPGAQSWSQGGFHEPASDSQRADERRLSVRRSRVVLASVADVKFAEVFAGPTGLGETANPRTTVTKRNSSPESTKQAVKTIAQETSGVPVNLW
jgi:hypothetical protein